MARFPDLTGSAGAIRPAKDDELDSLWRKVSGRCLLTVRETDRPNAIRRHAVLRLDPTHCIISGDLFRDEARRHWLFSWRSDAIYLMRRAEDGWDFAALCRPYLAQPDEAAQGARVFVSALLDHPGRTTIENFRMALIDGRGSSYDMTLDPETEVQRQPEYRQIRVFFVVDDTLLADPDLRALVEHVTAVPTVEGTGPVLSELSREGLLDPGSRRRLEADRLQTYAGGDRAEDAVAGLMGEIARLPLRDDNSFTIFLSGATDMGATDEVPLGRTLGLDMMPRRFGDRRAAIVFPRELVESCRRQIGPGADAEATFKYVAHRLTFTILHELGHLLNLPHPWQRDIFAASGMPAEPQARSWMNYASLYPLGIANDFALAGSADAGQRRKLTDKVAGANFAGELAEGVSFTREERIHLFHAPHDRIAAGARTFIDAERQALKVQAASSPSPLRLTIDGAAAIPGGGEEVRLDDYAQLTLAAMLQPPSGEVRLRLPIDDLGPVGVDGYPFRFGLDNLIWLFRQEYETLWSDAGPRAQIRYDGALMAIAPEVLRPAPHLNPDRGGAAGAEWVEFVAPLPHLRSRVLIDGLNWCRTLQHPGRAHPPRRPHPAVQHRAPDLRPEPRGNPLRPGDHGRSRRSWRTRRCPPSSRPRSITRPRRSMRSTRCRS